MMRKSKKGYIPYLILLGSCMLAAPVVVTWFSRKSVETCMEVFVTGIISFAILIVEYLLHREQNRNCMGQKMDIRLFLVAFSILTLLVSAYPLMRPLAWPFLFLALLLSFLTDQRLAIASYAVLVIQPCMMAHCDVNYVFLFLVSGLVVQLLFGNLDDSYRIGIPTFLSACVFLVLSVADIFLFNDVALNIESFLLPLVNVFVNLVLMIVVLHIYSRSFLHRFRDRYLTVNDTEFVLLAEAREQDPDTYYKAIHTSYLAERLAAFFQLDRDSTKSASYYWRLSEKRLQRQQEESAGIPELLAEYDFPEEAVQLLEELVSEKRPVTREATAVYMSDCVIGLLTDLFEKDNKVRLDYTEFFRRLFEEKYREGAFNQCDFSIRQICEMRELFIKEALYYDFLRRE